MARNTGYGSRVGGHDGRFTSAKLVGGTFRGVRPPSRLARLLGEFHPRRWPLPVLAAAARARVAADAKRGVDTPARIRRLANQEMTP